MNDSESEVYLYHKLGFVDKKNNTLDKYGICSPCDLFRLDRNLFHQTSYIVYQERAKNFLKKSHVSDEDVLKYLDTARLPCTSKCIFFSFASVKDFGFPIKDDSIELKVPLSLIEKLSIGNPIIFLSVHQTEVSFDYVRNYIDNLKKEAIKGSLKHNDSYLRYKYIKHIAIPCNTIPKSECIVVDNFTSPLYKKFHISSIKMIEPIFDMVKKKYVDKYNIMLPDVKLELSEVPRYTDGKENRKIPTYMYGGSWADTKVIYINPDAIKSYCYYTGRKIEQVTKKEFDSFLHLLLAHELAHGFDKFVVSKEFRESVLEDAEKNNFTTSYLSQYDKGTEIYNKECFAEYMANSINDNK